MPAMSRMRRARAPPFEVGKGWTVRTSPRRALDPVSFADDFMRTADTPGAWRSERGHWRLQTAWDEDPHGNAVDHFQDMRLAQNPVFLATGSRKTAPALCTTGNTSWEDYTFTAAVRPGTHGAVVWRAISMSTATAISSVGVPRKTAARKGIACTCSSSPPASRRVLASYTAGISPAMVSGSR